MNRTTTFRAAVAALLAVAAAALAAPAPAQAQAEPPVAIVIWSPWPEWDRRCTYRQSAGDGHFELADNASINSLYVEACDDVGVIQIMNASDADPTVAQRPYDVRVTVLTYLVQEPDVVCAARIDQGLLRRVSALPQAVRVPQTLSGCGVTVELENDFLYGCATSLSPPAHRCGDILRP